MNITRSSVYQAAILPKEPKTGTLPTANPALINSGAPGASRAQFQVISQPEVDTASAAIRRT